MMVEPNTTVLMSLFLVIFLCLRNATQEIYIRYDVI